MTQGVTSGLPLSGESVPHHGDVTKGFKLRGSVSTHCTTKEGHFAEVNMRSGPICRALSWITFRETVNVEA